MIINSDESIQNVCYIKDEEVIAIKNFLQGAVYSWCISNPDDSEGWFALRNLVGGDNWNWEGTPLQALHDGNMKKGKTSEEATEQSGRDAGRLLKAVIKDDIRNFKIRNDYVLEYLWVKE